MGLGRSGRLEVEVRRLDGCIGNPAPQVLIQAERVQRSDLDHRVSFRKRGHRPVRLRRRRPRRRRRSGVVAVVAFVVGVVVVVSGGGVAAAVAVAAEAAD